MDAHKLAQLLADGHITQDEHDEMLRDYEAKQAALDEDKEVEQFRTDVHNAGVAGKKRIIREKVIDLNVDAALLEDRFDRREKQRTASRLKFAMRGSGGYSF